LAQVIWSLFADRLRTYPVSWRCLLLSRGAGFQVGIRQFEFASVLAFFGNGYFSDRW